MHRAPPIRLAVILLSTVLSGTVLSRPLRAQGQATLPAGFLTTEADAYSIDFGGWPSMRCQVFNSDHRGKTRSVKEVACRRDGGRDASVFHFAGRSWTNVTLTTAESDYAKASSTFSLNLSSNVKQVFSGSVTWPDHSVGKKTSTPHTWGTDVRFPFAAPWAYQGNLDMTLDFVFRGGILANNAVWTTTRKYFLDGVHAQTRAGGSSQNFGTNNCTSSPFTLAPFCTPVVHTYAAKTGNPNLDNKFEFAWWLYRYPPKTPIVLAVSLLGSTTGVNIANPCQNLFVSLGPTFMHVAVTPSTNASSMFFPRPGLVNKYDARAIGAKIWTQAAYTHPTRNRFELTRGGVSTIQPQPAPVVGTRWTWAGSATAAVGGAPNATYMPLLGVAF